MQQIILYQYQLKKKKKMLYQYEKIFHSHLTSITHNLKQIIVVYVDIVSYILIHESVISKKKKKIHYFNVTWLVHIHVLQFTRLSKAIIPVLVKKKSSLLKIKLISINQSMRKCTRSFPKNPFFLHTHIYPKLPKKKIK